MPKHSSPAQPTQHHNIQTDKIDNCSYEITNEKLIKKFIRLIILIIYQLLGNMNETINLHKGHHKLNI